MLVLFGPDINLPYMIVSTGHGISQVTCVVEIKHLKKPYIVYRGENILCYTILCHKNSFFRFWFSQKHSKRFTGADLRTEEPLLVTTALSLPSFFARSSCGSCKFVNS